MSTLDFHLFWINREITGDSNEHEGETRVFSKQEDCDVTKTDVKRLKVPSLISVEFKVKDFSPPVQ